MIQDADELRAERDFLMKLRTTHRSTIQTLELQKASFAGMHPPYIEHQLRHTFEELSTTEQRIRDIDTQLQHAATATPYAEEQPNLPDLSSRYCEHLIATHQTLSFQGVLQTAKPIALPLLAIYVATRLTPGSGNYDTMSAQERRILAQLEGPCDDTTRQRLEQELEALERTRWSSQSSRVHLAEVLKTAPVSIILGDPGSGKSTLFRYLALVFAQHTAPEQLKVDDQRLPILVPLAAYDRALRTKTLPLSDFLAQYYAEYHEVPGLAPLFQTALDSGQALVLLDGLDEVVDNNTRVEIANRVQSFITRYAASGNRILITSRIVGYRTAPLPGDHPHYTVADFGMAEIERFTQQWCYAYESYIHGPTSEAQQSARREHRQLMDAIKGAPGIERLAANPLLLTILALIHRQGQSLPRRRVQLYGVYLDTLLEHWSRARQQGLVVGKALDTFDTIPLLGPLALWLQTTKPAGTAQYHDVLREVTRILTARGSQDPDREARSWLADLREHSGLLVQRGADAWGFLHLTFQEYLAAWGLVRMPADERWTTLRPHLHDPRWNEVIHLTAGILGVIQQNEAAVTQFVDTLLMAGSRVENLLHRDLFLAASIVADDVGVAPAVGQRIIQQLADVWWEEVHALQAQSSRGWWSGSGSHRYKVAQLAAKLRGTPYLTHLLAQLHPALTDADKNVQHDAAFVFGMAHTWDTLAPFLRNIRFSHDDWLGSLLIEDEQWDLVQVWIEQSSFSDPTVLCQDLAAADRWDLIECIVEKSEFPDDSLRNFVSLLITYEQWDWIADILDHGYDHEREDVIVALGDHGLLDKIRFALTDKDAQVREAAVWSFAEAGELSTVEPLLQDPNEWVRRAVFGAFANAQQWERVKEGLKDVHPIVRSAVLRWLHDDMPQAVDLPAYLTDPDREMRQTIIDLLDTTVHEQHIRSLLHDSDRFIRQRAIHKLAQAGIWDAIEPFTQDLDPELRKAAIQVMRRQAPLAVVRSVLNDDDPVLRQRVIETAAQHHTWDVLWTALDDPDPKIQQAALRALVGHPQMTLEEQARIEEKFRMWDVRASSGTTMLNDLVTHYEQTLKQREAR